MMLKALNLRLFSAIDKREEIPPEILARAAACQNLQRVTHGEEGIGLAENIDVYPFSPHGGQGRRFGPDELQGCGAHRHNLAWADLINQNLQFGARRHDFSGVEMSPAGGAPRQRWGE